MYKIAVTKPKEDNIDQIIEKQLRKLNGKQNKEIYKTAQQLIKINNELRTVKSITEDKTNKKIDLQINVQRNTQRNKKINIKQNKINLKAALKIGKLINRECFRNHSISIVIRFGPFNIHKFCLSAGIENDWNNLELKGLYTSLSDLKQYNINNNQSKNAYKEESTIKRINNKINNGLVEIPQMLQTLGDNTLILKLSSNEPKETVSEISIFLQTVIRVLNI